MLVKIVTIIIVIYLIIYFKFQRQFQKDINLSVDNWEEPSNMRNEFTLYTNPPEEALKKLSNLQSDKTSKYIHYEYYPQLYYSPKEITLYLFPFANNSTLNLSRVNVSDKTTFPDGFDQIEHMTLSLEPGQCAVIPCGWRCGIDGDVSIVKRFSLQKGKYSFLYAPEIFLKWNIINE